MNYNDSNAAALPLSSCDNYGDLVMGDAMMLDSSDSSSSSSSTSSSSSYCGYLFVSDIDILVALGIPAVGNSQPLKAINQHVYLKQGSSGLWQYGPSVADLRVGTKPSIHPVDNLLLIGVKDHVFGRELMEWEKSLG